MEAWRDDAMASLDMTEILLETYRLADQIIESEEVSLYLQLKKQLRENAQVQALIREFQKKKERFEECQRFGHYHPDYHAAKEEAEAFQRRMRKHPLIAAYLEAEAALDQLLHQVSRTIAHSVSESIKVPANDPLDGNTSVKRCGFTV